jgi:hypothetical protein
LCSASSRSDCIAAVALQRVSLRCKRNVTGLTMDISACTTRLILVLSFLSTLSTLSLLFFGSTLGQRWRFPLSTLFLFFLHCIRYPSACTAGALFLSESQWKAARRSRRTTSNDYMSGNEQMNNQEWRGGLRAPLLLLPLSKTILPSLSFSLCHTPGPCLLATIALQSPLHTIGTGAYTQKQLGRWFSMLPPTPSGPYAHGLLSVLFLWVSQMYTGVVLSFHCRISLPFTPSSIGGYNPANP